MESKKNSSTPAKENMQLGSYINNSELFDTPDSLTKRKSIETHVKVISIERSVPNESKDSLKNSQSLDPQVFTSKTEPFQSSDKQPVETVETVKNKDQPHHKSKKSQLRYKEFQPDMFRTEPDQNSYSDIPEGQRVSNIQQFHNTMNPAYKATYKVTPSSLKPLTKQQERMAYLLNKQKGQLQTIESKNSSRSRQHDASTLQHDANWRIEHLSTTDLKQGKSLWHDSSQQDRLRHEHKRAETAQNGTRHMNSDYLTRNQYATLPAQQDRAKGVILVDEQGRISKENQDHRSADMFQNQFASTPEEKKPHRVLKNKAFASIERSQKTFKRRKDSNPLNISKDGSVNLTNKPSYKDKLIEVPVKAIRTASKNTRQVKQLKSLKYLNIRSNSMVKTALQNRNSLIHTSHSQSRAYGSLSNALNANQAINLQANPYQSVLKQELNTISHSRGSAPPLTDVSNPKIKQSVLDSASNTWYHLPVSKNNDKSGVDINLTQTSFHRPSTQDSLELHSITTAVKQHKNFYEVTMTSLEKELFKILEWQDQNKSKETPEITFSKIKQKQIEETVKKLKQATWKIPQFNQILTYLHEQVTDQFLKYENTLELKEQQYEEKIKDYIKQFEKADKEADYWKTEMQEELAEKERILNDKKGDIMQLIKEYFKMGKLQDEPEHAVDYEGIQRNYSGLMNDLSQVYEKLISSYTQVEQIAPTRKSKRFSLNPDVRVVDRLERDLKAREDHVQTETAKKMVARFHKVLETADVAVETDPDEIVKMQQEYEDQLNLIAEECLNQTKKAERAEKERETSDLLLTVKIREMSEANKMIANMEERVEVLNEQDKEMREKISEFEYRLRTKDQQINDLRVMQEALVNDLSQQIKLIKDRDSKLKVERAQNTHYQEKHEQLTKEVDKLEKDLDKWSQKYNQLMEEMLSDTITTKRKYAHKIGGKDYGFLIELDMLSDEEFAKFAVGMQICDELSFNEERKERVMRIINRWFDQRIDEMDDADMKKKYNNLRESVVGNYEQRVRRRKTELLTGKKLSSAEIFKERKKSINIENLNKIGSASTESRRSSMYNMNLSRNHSRDATLSSQKDKISNAKSQLSHKIEEVAEQSSSSDGNQGEEVDVKGKKKRHRRKGTFLKDKKTGIDAAAKSPPVKVKSPDVTEMEDGSKEVITYNICPKCNRKERVRKEIRKTKKVMFMQDIAEEEEHAIAKLEKMMRGRNSIVPSMMFKNVVNRMANIHYDRSDSKKPSSLSPFRSEYSESSSSLTDIKQTKGFKMIGRKLNEDGGLSEFKNESIAESIDQANKTYRETCRRPTVYPFKDKKKSRHQSMAFKSDSPLKGMKMKSSSKISSKKEVQKITSVAELIKRHISSNSKMIERYAPQEREFLNQLAESYDSAEMFRDAKQGPDFKAFQRKLIDDLSKSQEFKNSDLAQVLRQLRGNGVDEATQTDDSLIGVDQLVKQRLQEILGKRLQPLQADIYEKGHVGGRTQSPVPSTIYASRSALIGVTGSFQTQSIAVDSQGTSPEVKHKFTTKIKSKVLSDSMKQKLASINLKRAKERKGDKYYYMTQVTDLRHKGISIDSASEAENE